MTQPELQVLPGGKEPPDPLKALVTILSEQRKINERMMQHAETASRRLEAQNEMLLEQVKTAHDTATRALKMQVELAEQREDLLSRRHERELAATMAQNRERALAEVLATVQSLLPLGAKQLMGIKLTGNDSHGLQDLLKALGPEQLEQLVTTGKMELNDAQRFLLVSVIQDMMAQESAKQAAQQPQESEQEQ